MLEERLKRDQAKWWEDVNKIHKTHNISGVKGTEIISFGDKMKIICKKWYIYLYILFFLSNFAHRLYKVTPQKQTKTSK